MNEVSSTDRIAMWLSDLEAAGWHRESLSVFKDPEGSLWRGPYGAWCELQRRIESRQQPCVQEEQR